jgi:hypothetical protein
MKAAIAAQSLQDQAILRNYYGRFLTRALRLVETQSRFKPAWLMLESQLAAPAVSGLAAEIRTFYGIAAAPASIARFVWWPDAEATQAKVRGRYILLQSPASSDAGTSMDWAPIPMHDFSHYMSADQPAAQSEDRPRFSESHSNRLGYIDPAIRHTSASTALCPAASAVDPA